MVVSDRLIWGDNYRRETVNQAVCAEGIDLPQNHWLNVISSFEMLNVTPLQNVDISTIINGDMTMM